MVHVCAGAHCTCPEAAIAYYNSLGVKVARVITDNGSCYKAFVFARACKRLKLKHIPPSPTHPRPLM
jgi:hypothetical protein